MALNPVPRLRSPTFAKPPDDLHQVTVSQDCPNYFMVQIPTSEGVKDAAQLAQIVWYSLWDIFGSTSFSTASEFKVSFDLGSDDQLEALCQKLSIHKDHENPNIFTISKAWWYQYCSIFSYPNEAKVWPICSSESQDQVIINTVKKLQNEMPPPHNTVYERYIAHLDSYFCLSIFGDSPKDVDLLHGWLNDPRVDEYWKDAGDRIFHQNWLQERYQDDHVLPMLGSFRGTNGADKNMIEPFAYYEIYWAAEDKISKAYPTEAFDRGIHMLVGSSPHRGPHRVQSWLPSLVHFIFDDNIHTKRILSEPDHRNIKMISYLEKYGFKKVKEFDMGHKVAAIMVLEKEEFWKHCSL